MKFPDAISTLLGKKEHQQNFFFSLFVDRDAAAVAAWFVDSSGAPKIVSYAHGKVSEDSWEARTQVVDRLISAVEDKAKVEQAISKTVFGMPGTYLTREGNIITEVRPHLKKLTTVLELSAVGFVPLSQAIAFSFKKDEGVPPSVILIGCSGDKATLTIFRVGKMVGEEIIDVTEDPSMEIELALKKYQHSDVLPSRILLYGGDESLLEIVRGKLLKHPWPTRANFLHFPKIELFSTEKLLTAVSLSGASELAAAMGGSEEGDITAQAASVIAQPTRNEKVEEQKLEEVRVEEEEKGEDENEMESTEEPDEIDETDDNQDDDTEDEEDVLGTEEDAQDTSESDTDQEESNIHVVSPEALGFERQDVLIAPTEKTIPSAPREERHPQKHTEQVHEPEKKNIRRGALLIPMLSKRGIEFLTSLRLRLPKPTGMVIPLVIAIACIALVAAGLYYMVPRATVTVLVAPVTLEESAVVTVDPAATIADPATKVIPGRTQEKSISGEKTAPVTGKKNVGDPARGTITIYNKVTSGRTFKKGTVVSAKSLTFTLDSDVSIASASESIGSITFGKASVAITAVEIGAAGNLPAATEFTFKDTGSSIASARNDDALAGGVSRAVTVVTRADYDAMVKALTDEMVGKAKSELSQQLGSEQLIDQTVKTTVAEKVFDKELDQEAKELHGKVTISVSGISIRDEDVKAILTSLVAAKVPGGYSLSGGQTDVTTRAITVKKDGKITLTATLKAVALPALDVGSLVAKLVGKKVSVATDILKQTRGVAGAEFRFVLSPTHGRLPINPKNITVSIAVGQ